VLNSVMIRSCDTVCVVNREELGGGGGGRGLTVALALLLRVGVVEEALAVVRPGHAAELDAMQPVVQRHRPLHPQEAHLHPV